MTDATPNLSAPLRIGRYALYEELASGGMATVFIGRLLGAAGFSRTVAIKRLHPQVARDREFAATLLDEARLAGRIHHPNVVTMLDVVTHDGELFIVMEYIAGEPLSALLRGQPRPLPLGAVLSLFDGALAGLHAAHEARDERGEPLQIVHRDVSPQNILVGLDGIARVLDFGIAKAVGRYQQTGQGVIKGKLGYMPPEQVRGEAIDRRADLYAAGVVLYEALTGRRLFRAESDWATVQRIFSGVREPPSLYRPDIPPELDDIVLRACHVDPEQRFASAEEFAHALDALRLSASQREVREVVAAACGERLAERAARVAAIERASLAELPPGPALPALPSAAPAPLASEALTQPAAPPPAAPPPAAPPPAAPPPAALPQPAAPLPAQATTLSAGELTIALRSSAPSPHRRALLAAGAASALLLGLTALRQPSPAAPAASAPASAEPPAPAPASSQAEPPAPPPPSASAPAASASPKQRAPASQPRRGGLFDNRH